MYAQVIRAAQVVGDELISALREEPGFVSMFDLVDRRAGETMVIVLWRTAEQASRAPGPRLRAALAAIDSTATSFWEVTARI
jgi:hypothetical protein